MKTLKCIAFSLCLWASSFAASQDSLYVFVPTEVRANVLQAHLASLCSDLNVIVFGRARDFHKEIQKAPPDALISLLTVVNRADQYMMLARGVKAGELEEEYILVSIDNPVDVSTLSDIKVGVVDLLGRKPMKQFVSQLFQKDIKIKRVMKQEDLLPLLSFGAVEAIFIPQSLFQNLKKRSRLNLVPTQVNIKLGLASAALESLPESRERFSSCLTKFDVSLNQSLGVEQWKLL